MELGPGEPAAGPSRFGWDDLMITGVLEPPREADRLWDEWEAEEVPFLDQDRRWERADFIVGTASWAPHDPRTEVARPA